MKKTWLSYINYILDFGPIIATVLVATLVSLRATQSRITSSEMLQFVLVLLAFLATTQLIDRFRVLRSIDTKVEQLVSLSRGPATADTFFYRRIPDSELERLCRANKIAVNGFTLITTIARRYIAFSNCLKEGGEIRLMAVNPNHAALEIAAARYHKHQDIKSIKREAETAKDHFELLYKEGNWGDRFQVRYSPFVSSYAIWLIDADTPNAEIWVWLFTFRVGPSPAFKLLPHKDKEWFNFFKSQFELMWEASEPWEPPQRGNTDGTSQRTGNNLTGAGPRPSCRHS